MCFPQLCFWLCLNLNKVAACRSSTLISDICRSKLTTLEGNATNNRQFNDHVGRYRLSSDDSSRQKEMVAKFSIWNSPFVFNQILPLISALRTGDSCRRRRPPPPLVISSLMTSRIYLTYISPPNIERPVLPRARKISLLSLDAFFESLVVDAHAPRSHGEQTELHHVTCPSRVHFHSQS